MMKFFCNGYLKFMTLLGCVLLSVSVLAQPPTKEWEMKSLGKTIYGGLLTGNGLLGTTTYLKSDSAIRVDIGRTDVYDHREDVENKLFTKARLPIGHFVIRMDDAASASGKMSLVNADATANVVSNHGSLIVKTTTLAEQNIILIELDRRQYKGNYEIAFMPEISQSPRFTFYPERFPTYKANPKVVEGKEQDIVFFDQKMTAGGGYCTAYKLVKQGDKEILIVSIDYATKGNAYKTDVIQKVAAFNRSQIGARLAKHHNWWNNYWALSSYQMPDEELQSFYDMQLYKMACATRADKPAIDLQGPWTSRTPWPAYWLNLNIQLTYSPFYTANRLSLAQSLIHIIDKNKQNLSLNVPKELQESCMAVGRSAPPDLTSPIPIGAHDNIETTEAVELSNLTWTLFYYYQHYRYSMNESMKAPLIDLLTRSTNFAINYLKKNKNGKYEFTVKTHSPEYPGSFDYNTNYDLSNLQWGLKTLLELTADNPKFNKDRQRWKEVQANLIDYPKNENGYMISSNQPFAVSHRHYSHLMMIYPFALVNYDQPENRTLIEKSLLHWNSMRSALQGYSLSGTASIYALMGKGDTAVVYLKRLLKQFVKPNTLYAETGPVIETPLSATASLQELSLQHWNGITRVFPAIPEHWKDLSFENFRTDGAFLISGNRKDGINQRVKVFSEKGGVLQIIPNITNAKTIVKGNCTITQQAGGVYKLKMSKGSVIEFLKQ